MITIDMLLAAARKRYSDILSAITIEVIIAKGLEKARVFLHAHPEFEIARQESDQINSDLNAAAKGKPLSYITGSKEFCGFPFLVSDKVLIPRPETEDIVRTIHEWILVMGVSSPQILDIGTGSGAIALSLAKLIPTSLLTAVDVSGDALDVAKMNSLALSLTDQVRFIQSDLFEQVTDRYDAIAANLPYIDSKELEILGVARWEPRLALDGGSQGMEIIERFFSRVLTHICQPGLVVLEIGSGQKEIVTQLAENVFPTSDIKVNKDLAGHDRIVVIYHG